MATSGTYTFNLDTGEIIQEAYERCGIETKSGYDLKTARRSLNLLLTKWVNDGVNLFTLDLETTDMTKDQGHITFSSTSHLDILDAAICHRKKLSIYIFNFSNSQSLFMAYTRPNILSISKLEY